MSTFKALGLSESLLEVLDSMGFETPTPIQEQAIPMLLSEHPKDFIGLAQTGTGKTAAFGLPLLDHVDQSMSQVQGLIMAPTRELGQQTAKQLVEFAKNQKKLNIECVYGGSNIATQIRALKRPTQIVVATPGRLLDLLDRRAISLDHVRYVVLDEADEMLQMGFKEDIDAILSRTPEGRTTWLFSATMPKDIRRIVKKYMTDPEEVSVNTEHKTNLDITHQYVVTQVKHKLPALKRFLDLQPDMRGVMFCRTRRETQQIADTLGDEGYTVEALHGDLSQAQRDAVMKRFKNRSMQLLVATDVAARGIDVNDLSHVIHHTLPDQLESYTHRSGRTGRAGKKGISMAFINSREGRKIDQLESKLKVQFAKVEVPSVEEVKTMRLKTWCKSMLRTEVIDAAQELYAEIGKELEALDKEELIKRLITRQLTHLQSDGSEMDLNEGASSTQRSNPNANRYFINIGAFDQVSEQELREFLAEVSERSAKDFSNFSIQKSCTFFDLDKEKDSGFAEVFEGLVVDGRPIRVNRDDGGGRSKGPRRGGKGRFSSGSRRGGSQGGHRGGSQGGHRGGKRGGGSYRSNDKQRGKGRKRS